MLSRNPDYVDLRTLGSLHFDLRYASTNNFMNKNVYGPFDVPFLHRDAAEKLKMAIHRLSELKPGWQFLIFDALRPCSVQKLLWNFVEGTPHEAYVANPAQGSIHSFGCAIDLTCVDEGKKEVEMGTAFDEFTEASEPQKEDELVHLGKLDPSHLQNRRILRQSLVDSGFVSIPHEWWHFNAFPSAEVRKRFQMIE